MAPSPHTAGTVAPELLLQLEQSARAAAAHAYAPYSRFHVGAAVLLEDAPGRETARIVAGCNVENASFRLTTCAEQAAITRAVAEFGPEIRLRAVLVVNGNGMPSQPCGACRQTILEFAAPVTPVYFPGEGGTLTSLSVADLLPSGFQLPVAE